MSANSVKTMTLLRPELRGEDLLVQRFPLACLRRPRAGRAGGGTCRRHRPAQDQLHEPSELVEVLERGVDHAVDFVLVADEVVLELLELLLGQSSAISSCQTSSRVER